MTDGMTAEKSGRGAVAVGGRPDSALAGVSSTGVGE